MDFLTYLGIRVGTITAICVGVYLLLQFSARWPKVRQLLVVTFSAIGGALFGAGIIWLLAFLGAPFLEKIAPKGSSFWDVVDATIAISIGAGIAGFIICGFIAIYVTRQASKQSPQHSG
jgi:hypothetical protein